MEINVENAQMILKSTQKVTLDESIKVIMKQKLQRNNERGMIPNPLWDLVNIEQDIER